MDWVKIVIAVLAALGGWKFVEWVLQWRSNKRKAAAGADVAELNADKEKFHLLQERLKFADEQNVKLFEQLAQMQKASVERENKYYEQTLLLRQQNEKIENLQDLLGDVKAEKEALLTERSMKLCEVRNCKNRKPQSGY